MSSHISNVRPDPDKVLADIADYVCDYKISSDEAYDTARNCLIDTLGCGLRLSGIQHAQSFWDLLFQALQFLTEQGFLAQISGSTL